MVMSNATADIDKKIITRKEDGVITQNM